MKANTMKILDIYRITIISFITLLITTMSASLVRAQDLPIIGIGTIKSTNDDYRSLYRGAQSFQTMLETQMLKVNRFTLMERSRVDDILAEQGLSNEFGDGNGSFNVNSVDYLVYGSITKLGTSKSGMATGKFSTASLVTEMSVDLRIVDASNGEIRAAETAEAMIKTAGATQTGNFASVKSGADPIADVQRLVAKQAAALIATSIFPIKVIKAGEEVYLNYGSSILDKGDTLIVFQPGESLIDEDTGLDLGSEETYVGELEVTESTGKFSKAKLLSGNKPSKNDLARIKQKASAAGKNGDGPRKKRGRKL
jgi:hypothetical protein